MNPENYNVSRTVVKPCGFIGAFIGCCCGTGIFVTLSRHSVWRMLLHLLLLALLISIPVTYFVGRRAEPEFSAAREIFISSFGKEILFNTEARGFQPAKDPRKARSAVFPGFGRIFYYPSVPEKLPDSSTYADLSCFAVWSPGNLSVAYRGTDSQWVVNTFNRSGISFFVSSRPEELFKIVPAEPTGKVIAFDSAQLFDEISFAYRIRVFVSHAAAVFILPLIYSLILQIVLRFTFAKVTSPNYFEWWKCGVYAAFPGALIASAINAFDLPLISFTTAYMLSAMVYGLHAVMRVEYEKSVVSEEYKDGK